MDQETRDYMDQKVVTLARKEDIEKLRGDFAAEQLYVRPKLAGLEAKVK